jgi:hypothetical protein
MKVAGRLVCRRTDGPACVTLVGRDDRGDPVHLTLVGTAPRGLPDSIVAATVESSRDDRYRIGDGSATWSMQARGYRHYDLAAAFYAAVPPRRPALAKRLFWQVVLAGAASRPGRWWLKHKSR